MYECKYLHTNIFLLPFSCSKTRNMEAGTNQQWELHEMPWMCGWSSSVGPRGDVCSTIWELSLPHVVAQLLSSLRGISSYLYVQVWLIISVTLHIYMELFFM